MTLEKRVLLYPFIFLNFIGPGSVQNLRVQHHSDDYKMPQKPTRQAQVVAGAFIDLATPALADPRSNSHKYRSPYGEDLHWGRSIFDIERIGLVQ